VKIKAKEERNSRIWRKYRTKNPKWRCI